MKIPRVTIIEHKCLVEAYQKLEAEHKKLQEEYEDVRQRHDGYRLQYSELMVKYYALDNQNKGLLMGIDHLKQEVQRLKGELGELQGVLP